MVRGRLQCWLSAGGSLLTALLIGVSSPQPAHAQNLLTNGSFEADNCNTTGGGYRLGLSGNDMTGWFIPSTDGVYPWCLQNVNAFGGGPAAQGNQWLVLGETGTGVHYTIQQTLTGLNVGSQYNLSFSIASESGCCSMAEVSFLSGSSTPFQTFTAPVSGQYWTQWAQDAMSFTASASSVTIQFQDITVGSLDLGLDDVSVVAATSPVPEPASIALLATGLIGIAGVGVKRRRNN